MADAINDTVALVAYVYISGIIRSRFWDSRDVLQAALDAEHPPTPTDPRRWVVEVRLEPPNSVAVYDLEIMRHVWARHLGDGSMKKAGGRVSPADPYVFFKPRGIRRLDLFRFDVPSDLKRLFFELPLLGQERTCFPLIGEAS